MANIPTDERVERALAAAKQWRESGLPPTSFYQNWVEAMAAEILTLRSAMLTAYSHLVDDHDEEAYEALRPFCAEAYARRAPDVTGEQK